MRTFTVSFFGHRRIYNAMSIEKSLEKHIRELLRSHEYVEFLVGRDEEFDQLVSSTVQRCKRTFRADNSFLVCVLPYQTSEYQHNEESFHVYYDEVEICNDSANAHYKAAFQIRNRQMVDRSTLIICCVDRKNGGAYRTMNYAKSQGKQVLNLGVLP